MASAFIAALTAVGGMWALMQLAAPQTPQLISVLPQGALLTIEAGDFSALLKRWNDSPEKRAWLKSDNYAVFSRSRLFGRLGDAQKDFARAAGLAPDSDFLNEVAGKQSVFAWYDIGRLEFLYITDMPADQADKTRLVQLRGKFTARQAGGQTFYIRNSASPSIAIPSSGDAADAGNDGNSGGGEIRTVAFATVGNRLILATREDLMAGALMLMSQAKDGSAKDGAAPADSLAAERWFSDARTAAAKDEGDLRMTLNLDRIVPSPYFRTYWVQRNVTEMKQYRSAVADLYLGSPDFHEERVLLPKAAPDAAKADVDLRSLTSLLPEHVGVYRAVASPDTAAAVASLDEKLLTRGMAGYRDGRYAPQATVAVQNTGSATDLETRIDEPAYAQPAKGSELDLLRQTIGDGDLTAMMTVDRTEQVRDGVWVPFASGVVLKASKPWDQAAMQAALKGAVSAHITASGVGLNWAALRVGDASYFELSETRPLEVAFQRSVCIVTNDPELMRDILLRGSHAVHPASKEASHLTLLAGFDLTSERAPYARWTTIVDRVGQRAGSASNSGQSDGQEDAGDSSYGGEPGFFSRNMRSLGAAFSALQSEQIAERRDGPFVRQTVTCAWKH